jgi:hypothetical protein
VFGKVENVRAVYKNQLYSCMVAVNKWETLNSEPFTTAPNITKPSE